jgi:hypothetical protein
MIRKDRDPLIVVSNPNSTGAREVQHEVLDVLEDLGITYDHIKVNTSVRPRAFPELSKNHR